MADKNKSEDFNVPDCDHVESKSKSQNSEAMATMNTAAKSATVNKPKGKSPGKSTVTVAKAKPMTAKAKAKTVADVDLREKMDRIENMMLQLIDGHSQSHFDHQVAGPSYDQHDGEMDEDFWGAGEEYNDFEEEIEERDPNEHIPLFPHLFPVGSKTAQAMNFNLKAKDKPATLSKPPAADKTNDSANTSSKEADKGDGASGEIGFAARFAEAADKGDPIDTNISIALRYLMGTKINETVLNETFERYGIPENCGTLCVPKVNHRRAAHTKTPNKD